MKKGLLEYKERKSERGTEKRGRGRGDDKCAILKILSLLIKSFRCFGHTHG